MKSNMRLASCVAFTLLSLQSLAQTSAPADDFSITLERLGCLGNDEFFGWEEKKEVCLDFPEVDITVTLNGHRKRVLEGCNSPGKVLRLADEIDRISGAKRWIGKVR